MATNKFYFIYTKPLALYNPCLQRDYNIQH